MIGIKRSSINISLGYSHQVFLTLHNYLIVSVRSLLDRFQIDEKQSAYLGNNAKKIFDALKPFHNLEDKYRELLDVEFGGVEFVVGEVGDVV